MDLSTLGLGTYLGPATDAGDAAYTEAALAFFAAGGNVFDTAANYRDGRSERALGAAFKGGEVPPLFFIGATLESCTFFHGCEEWAECPWLFTKTQEQLYSITAADRVIAVPSYRHAPNNPRRYPTLEEPLKELGILTLGVLGDCPLRLLDAPKAADWLVTRLREDPELVVDRTIS